MKEIKSLTYDNLHVWAATRTLWKRSSLSLTITYMCELPHGHYERDQVSHLRLLTCVSRHTDTMKEIKSLTYDNLHVWAATRTLWKRSSLSLTITYMCELPHGHYERDQVSHLRLLTCVSRHTDTMKEIKSLTYDNLHVWAATRTLWKRSRLSLTITYMCELPHGHYEWDQVSHLRLLTCVSRHTDTMKEIKSLTYDNLHVWAATRTLWKWSSISLTITYMCESPHRHYEWDQVSCLGLLTCVSCHTDTMNEIKSLTYDNLHVWAATQTLWMRSSLLLGITYMCEPPHRQ